MDRLCYVFCLSPIGNPCVTLIPLEVLKADYELMLRDGIALFLCGIKAPPCLFVELR